MMWWWGDHWGIGGWVGIGFTAVFWIAVIVGLVFLIRHLSSGSKATGQQSSQPGTTAPPEGGQSPEKGRPAGANTEALRILEERYARGEIDRDEFMQRKADLTG